MLLQRQRTAAVAPTPRLGAVEAAPVTAATVPALTGVDVVIGRDQALRNCLRQGPASFDELLAAMPEEPLLTDEQRRLATNNCLSRLRLRRQVDTDGRVWRLLA